MYKCWKCGRVVPHEKLLKNLDGRLICTCGSRIFVKVRPNVFKRVKARQGEL